MAVNGVLCCLCYFTLCICNILVPLSLGANVIRYSIVPPKIRVGGRVIHVEYGNNRVINDPPANVPLQKVLHDRYCRFLEG